MNAARIPFAVLGLALAVVVGACGPNNTLSLHGGGEGSRLGAVESGLKKAQGDIKDLERKQAQTEAHVAELQKKLGIAPTQAARPAPPVPRASALGEGFVRPAAEGAPNEAVAHAAEPAPAAPEPSRPDAQTPPTFQPTQAAPAAQPTPQATLPTQESLPPQFPPMPQTALPSQTATPSPAAEPPQAAVPPQATAAQPPVGIHPPATPAKAAPPARVAGQKPVLPPKGPHGKGWIGPPATSPATPEAAIAADRAARPAPAAAEAPQPASLPLPPAAKGPAAPEPTAAKPATAPAEPAPAAAPQQPAAEPQAPADKTPETPVAGKAQTASPAEKAEYNKALQLAINGHQAESKAAFDQFLAAHPQSPLTPNAMYWLGEGAYQRGDYKAAIGEFDKVAKGWPGHHKAADALYKIAQVQEKSGDVAAARATLERYLRDYPNAELAGAARQKLQALPK